MNCRAWILSVAMVVASGQANAQQPPAAPLPDAASLPSSGIEALGANLPAGAQPLNGAGSAAPDGALIVPAGRDASTYAYESAAEQLLPLTPKEIEAYRVARQRIEKASLENTAPANLAGTVRTIDMTDGAPRTLSLVSNFSTVIMPLGANGAPWPITQVISANPEIVNVTQPQGRTTAAVLAVKQAWMRTNITVFLDGRAEPVILFIDTTADAIDGLDARVGLLLSGIPPGTTLPPVKNIAGVDSSLLNAVHLAPGAGWTAFDVKADQETLPFKISAWAGGNGEETIVRLHGAVLLSPAWDAQVSNADGDVKAYRYGKRPFMFLVSDADGVTHRIRAAAATAQLAAGSRAKLEVEALSTRRIVEAEELGAATPSATKSPRAQPMSLTGKSSVTRVASSARASDAAREKATSSEAPGQDGAVRGAAALPKTQSNLKPIFLTGSEAIRRVAASRAQTETGAAAHEAGNPGAAFAKATGTALTPPPDVTTAADPILASTAVSEGLWQFRVNGPSLRYNLERLARDAGWSRLVWKSSDDYRVSDGLVFRGADALEVVRKILDRYPLRLEFYELNQVGVVVPRSSRSGFIGEQ